MPELHALQNLFSRALRDSADEAPLLAHLVGHARAGLDAYRRNALLNAHKALCLHFPVLERVVGDEFMRALARDFWQAYPSREGDLNFYGADLAGFLAPHPAVAEMPWLADLAALEWAVHQAGMAADHAPIGFDALSGLAPEAIGRHRLILQPALRLIDSDWPLASIWLQHQPDYADELDLAGRGAETALVLRAGLRVEVRSLAPPEAAFWHAARIGQPLEAQIGAAFERDARFDPAACLRDAFAAGLIVSLEDTEP